MKRISLVTLKNIPIKEHGLSDTEVKDQRNRFGSNTILDSGKNRWHEVFQDTIRDPMVWFLGGVSFLFFVVGQKTDALTLLIAILPLAFMDAFLHWRTRSATSSLKGNLNTTVRVIRESAERRINSQDIVPGDLLKVVSGDVMPADGLIERSVDLQIDESVLTGESFPIKKRHYAIQFVDEGVDEILVESEVLAFAGTKILTGESLVRVLCTGQYTSYGEIVRSVAEMPLERTPLQVAIGRLVRGLIVAALFLCALLAFIRLYQGHSWIDSVLAAATLAVAAIPEEFPVVFTFFLGVGIFRLAKRRALVRRAVSVENIGRVTHICTDKTGTITQGRLTLSHLDPSEPEGSRELIEAALTASNPANVDPIDLAILRYAKEAVGVDQKTIISHRFPFTEDRKKETVLIRNQDGFTAFSKGAPETVLGSVALGEQEKTLVLARVAHFAETGHKVLACAKRKLGENDAGQREPTEGFEFLGLLAFEDPARPEVFLAIASARSLGIKVIMITGDHPATARAIAKDVGLGEKAPHVISAEDEPERFELQYLETHPSFLQSTDVIARCTPIQKLRVVKALKHQGHLVAVTGDGVNDVPALKAADVGIAMGERGSQSAKEVSSIILADDNFKTIVGAIQEGRQLYQNLRSAFEYLILIHFPFVLSAALLPLLGHPILYLPIHIVWLELIIHPSAILAFQSPAQVENASPRTGFFSKKDILRILLSGILVVALITWLYLSDLNGGFEVEVARTRVLAALSMWSACIVVVLTKAKGISPKVIAVITVVATFLLIQQWTSIGSYLHVVPLERHQWFEITALLSVIMIMSWLVRIVPSRRTVEP
ncbi:MAG: cation-translocating P-type ATPase [Bdellovibrionales bacterium]